MGICSGKPLVPSDGVQRELRPKWTAGLFSACYHHPCCCIAACCFPCCTAMSLRGRALKTHDDSFHCGQEFVCPTAAHEVDECFEECCPKFGACLEAYCCTCCSAMGTREYIRQKRLVRADRCDNRIMRINNCCVCLCRKQGMPVNDYINREAPLNCCGYLLHCCIVPCMLIQAYSELVAISEGAKPGDEKSNSHDSSCCNCYSCCCCCDGPSAQVHPSPLSPIQRDNHFSITSQPRGTSKALRPETPPDLRARKMQLLSMAAQSDDEETEDDPFFPTRREIEELRRKHHRQQNDDYKHRVLGFKRPKSTRRDLPSLEEDNEARKAALLAVWGSADERVRTDQRHPKAGLRHTIGVVGRRPTSHYDSDSKKHELGTVSYRVPSKKGDRHPDGASDDEDSEIALPYVNEKEEYEMAKLRERALERGQKLMSGKVAPRLSSTVKSLSSLADEDEAEPEPETPRRRLEKTSPTNSLGRPKSAMKGSRRTGTSKSEVKFASGSSPLNRSTTAPRRSSPLVSPRKF